MSMKKVIFILQIFLLIVLLCSCEPMQPNFNSVNSKFESDTETKSSDNKQLENNVSQTENTQLEGNNSKLETNYDKDIGTLGPTTVDFVILPDNEPFTTEINATEDLSGNITFNLISMHLYSKDNIDDNLLKNIVPGINKDIENLLLVQLEFINNNIDINSLSENQFLVNCFSLMNCEDPLYYARLVYFDKTDSSRPDNEYFYYKIPNIDHKDIFTLGWIISENDMEFLSADKGVLRSSYITIKDSYNSFKLNFENIIIH